MKNLDKIHKSTIARLEAVHEIMMHPQYTILNLVLNELDKIACYELFGYSNQSLEGVEWLHSMLINAFYDDSEMHIRKQVDEQGTEMNQWTAEYQGEDSYDIEYEYVLEWGAKLENESRRVTLDQITSIVETKIAERKWRKEHEEWANADFGSDELIAWLDKGDETNNLIKEIYEENLFNE